MRPKYHLLIVNWHGPNGPNGPNGPTKKAQRKSQKWVSIYSNDEQSSRVERLGPHLSWHDWRGPPGLWSWPDTAVETMPNRTNANSCNRMVARMIGGGRWEYAICWFGWVLTWSTCFESCWLRIGYDSSKLALSLIFFLRHLVGVNPLSHCWCWMWMDLTLSLRWDSPQVQHPTHRYEERWMT